MADYPFMPPLETKERERPIPTSQRARPPARVARLALARLRFPEQCRTLLPGLVQGDDAADHLITSLEEHDPSARRLSLRKAASRESDSDEAARLYAEMDELPSWVDWDRVERGSRVFFRAGLLGGLSLALGCLVQGYAAPAGNKPLVLTGALLRKAERRLAETASFVRAVSSFGGLRLGGEGRVAALRVRLMHAEVRRLVSQDPRWEEDWGTPLNQHDMLATVLLFSSEYLRFVRRFGVSVSAQEADDFQHLWRYVGYLLGVKDELLPRTAVEAQRASAFIRLTQWAPDADSRALTRALLHAPLTRARTPDELRRAQSAVRVASAVSRGLLGNDAADALGIPSSRGMRWVSAVSTVVSGLELVRSRTLRVDRFVQWLGESYWTEATERGLKEGGPLYVPPPTLLGGVSRALAS